MLGRLPCRGMCGRYTHKYTWRQIHAHLVAFEAAIAALLDGPAPSYNVAPKATIPALRSDGSALEIFAPQWWLVPAWSKTREISYATFNAKSEEAASKPAFRDPFRNRRCVIPASGFYEWKKAGDGAKQPHYIQRADGDPIYFAGLWDRWEGADEALDSCTILTTSPNAEMSELHDRMPCILEPEQVAPWCDPGLTDVDAIQAFLRPAADGILSTWPVSHRVGSVRNNDPSLADPIEDGPSGLFEFGS